MEATGPASSPVIQGVSARRVWDSRGRPTVEAEVRLAGGVIGRAIAPAGASTGRGEATDLRDGGTRPGRARRDGRGAQRQRGDRTRAARTQRHRPGRPRPDADRSGRHGRQAPPRRQRAHRGLDGGAARRRRRRGPSPVAPPPSATPLPCCRCPRSRSSAEAPTQGRRVDIQDYMVMPVGASTFRGGARMDRQRCTWPRASGWPGRAGGRESPTRAATGRRSTRTRTGWRAWSEPSRTPGARPATTSPSRSTSPHRSCTKRGRYRLDGRAIDGDGLSELLIGWLDRYPIVSIEDPLAEDDVAGMQRFTAAVGHRVQVVGDDYLVTDAARVERAARDRACKRAAGQAEPGRHRDRDAGPPSTRRAPPAFAAIVSARSGETEDVTVAHLAVGWTAGQLKVGLVRAVRAHGEVERGAADRGSAGRRGHVRPAGSVLAPRRSG